MVEQQHLHLTTVVGIDNTGTSVDKVLRGQTTPGSDTAIYTTNTKKSASTFKPIPPIHPIQFESNVQVPSGTAIAIPVSISALPFAGTTVSLAAYISYPAAKAEPRVGALAVSTSFLINSGGRGAWIEVTAGALEAVMSALLVVFVRLGSGEAGREGGSRAVLAAGMAEGGVVSLVIAGEDEVIGRWRRRGVIEVMDWRSIDHSVVGEEVVELRCSLNSERLVPLARFTAGTRRGRVGGEERRKEGVCVVCFLGSRGYT